MKALTVGFLIPDNDSTIENKNFFTTLSKAGPHIDFMKRLQEAALGRGDFVGWQFEGSYCHDPVPSQPAYCILLCNEENAFALESIIYDTVGDDDHGLLEMSLDIEDSADVLQHEGHLHAI